MSLNHNYIACARNACAAVITVHPGEEDRLRRSGETFYCPAGHSNFFPVGKTDEQKTIEKLERELERERGWHEDTVERQQHALGVVSQMRGGTQVCPMGCGWRTNRRLAWHPEPSDVARFYDRVYADLREHMVRDHNATVAPVALLEEVTS